jgi:hypothetical protein
MSKKVDKEEETRLKKSLLWLIDKRVYIFSILASIVFINVIIYKIKPLFGKKSPEGSFLADQSFMDWKESSYKDDEKLKKLKYFIKKYPNLKPKYEGLILQNLLINSDFGKEDYKLADKALLRTKEELPLYYEYSKAAIMITNNEFKEALDISKKLKDIMLKDLSFLKNETLPAGAVLYSFNLLRIALLQGKLNNDKEELLAWQELEEYLNLGTIPINDQIKIANDALKEMFNEKNIELIDYISYRKNRLSSIRS